MSDYDLLYGVVLRLEGGNGAKLYKNIDEISKRLGEAINKEFQDFIAVPFGFELVEPDKKVRILNKIEYNDEFPETDEELEEV